MRARPVANPRSPIHRSEVPVKVKVARPPAVTLCRAFSPLHKVDWPLCVQSAVKAIDGSVSCTRVTVGVSTGTASNASTATQAAVAAGCDALFLEVHPRPDEALSDGPNALRLDDLEGLLRVCLRLREAITVILSERGWIRVRVTVSQGEGSQLRLAAQVEDSCERR